MLQKPDRRQQLSSHHLSKNNLTPLLLVGQPLPSEWYWPRREEHIWHLVPVCVCVFMKVRNSLQSSLSFESSSLFNLSLLRLFGTKFSLHLSFCFFRENALKISLPVLKKDRAILLCWLGKIVRVVQSGFFFFLFVYQVTTLNFLSWHVKFWYKIRRRCIIKAWRTVQITLEK